MRQAASSPARIGGRVSEEEWEHAFAGELLDVRPLVGEKPDASRRGGCNFRGGGAREEYPAAERDGVRPEDSRQRARCEAVVQAGNGRRVQGDSGEVQRFASGSGSVLRRFAICLTSTEYPI